MGCRLPGVLYPADIYVSELKTGQPYLARDKKNPGTWHPLAAGAMAKVAGTWHQNIRRRIFLLKAPGYRKPDTGCRLKRRPIYLLKDPAINFYPETNFNPNIEVMSMISHKIRQRFTGSLKINIPIMTVPTVPIPVHIA